MREIKFRAWDIRHKKMVMDALKTSETEQLVTVNADYFNSPFSFFDGCKWMQYIGLKDKNAKEIYEGDILKHNDNIFVIKYTQEVCAVFGFYLEDIKWGNNNANWRDLSWLNRVAKHTTIIGNIYENPNLLSK